MATVQKTIKESGGDYVSMLALANTDTDLVAAGDSWEVTCDPFEDSAGKADFNGWEIGPSNTLLIKPTVKPTTPGSIDTNSYRLVVAADGFTLGDVGGTGAIVTLQDIQIKSTGSNNDPIMDSYNGAAATNPLLILDRCTLISDASCAVYFSRGTDGTDMKAINSAFVGARSDGGVVYQPAGSLGNYYNCVFISKYATTAYCFQGHANVACYGCYAGKAAEGGYGFSLSPLTDCWSSDSGDTGIDGTLAYDASLFVSVVAGAEDFHLVAGDTSLDGVAAPNANALTDWNETVRGLVATDVGLHEFVLTPDDVPHDPSLGVFVDSDCATDITDAPLGLTILADPYTLENKYLGGVIYAQALAHANKQAYVGVHIYSEGDPITPAHVGLYVDALPLITVPNAYMGLHSSGLYQPTNASLGVFMYGHPAEDHIIETQGRLLVKANSEDATEQVLNIDAVTIFKGLGTASLNAQWIAKRQAIAEFYAKMKVVRYINPPIVEIIQVNYMEADGEPDGSGLLPVENFYEGARRIQVVVSGSLGDSSEWISSQIDFGEPWRGDAATTLSSISGFTTDPLWTADHVYETSGNYIITARGVDSYGSVGSDLRVLNLASGYVPGVDYPAMSISATPRLGDVPPALEVEFTTTPSGTFFISSPTDSRIFWNMGNRETSKRKDPTTYYSSPGLYTPVCRLRYSHPDGGYIWIADSLRIGYNY